MTGFYITIKNGLLDPKHIKKMKGDEGWGTIWLFLWLLDKMTIVNEEIGEGKVLGGKPIKFEEIHKDIGISRATYARYIDLLRSEGYIKTTRTPFGLIIVIYKAFKIFGQKTDVSPKTHLIDRSVRHHYTDRETSNKTIQYDNTVDIEKKPCLNSLTPCKDECYWKIGMKYDTLARNVKSIAETLELKLTNEPKIKKKYTSFHLTLIQWVKNAFAWNQIEHMSETERMEMEHDSPEKVAERKKLHELAIQGGTL